MTVHISIGNSDDKLSQVKWSEFIVAIETAICTCCSTTYGFWLSVPSAPWQNACWAVEPSDQNTFREILSHLAAEYGQESIAWAESPTEFLPPVRSERLKSFRQR